MSTTADGTPLSVVLTIDQAAAYLAIPKATLYTWRTRRAGFGPPAIKAGGRLLYRRADLDTWLERHLEHFEETDDAGAGSGGAARDLGVSLSRPSGPR